MSGSRTNQFLYIGSIALIAGLAMLGTACQMDPGAPFERGDEQQEVVYGIDNREDVYAYSDPVFAARAAEFVVALMDSSSLDTSNPSDVQVIANTLGQDIGLCSGERFFDQLSPAWCSGTLVAPDLVMTAGHCVSDAFDCANTTFVFNFYMTDATTLQTITTNDIYSCVEVMVQDQVGTGVDYSIVRLDRPVTGRTPAQVTNSVSEVPNGTELVVAGFPSGIPIKIDNGGWVRDSRAGTLDFFVANLDTFGGNSGSGVFLESTSELVGILVRGESDYNWNAGCYVVNTCSETGCRGEDCTYAFRAVEDLCATVGTSPLCACGDGTCDGGIGETTVTCPDDCGTICGDGACNGSESPIDCPQDCGLCGNLVCDTGAGEDEASCCTDCGCTGTDVCIGNNCVPDPGAGDTCVDPVVITPSGTQVLPGDTTFALDDYTPSCSTSNATDRVYVFTLADTLSVDAQVEGYDTILSMRTTCDDPATELDCNDDSTPPGSMGSRILRTLGPGTYYLIVDGYQSNSGPYTLTVTFTPPLAGDTCADPVSILAAGTQVINSDSDTATDDYDVTNCNGGGGPDQVYSFTIATPHDVTAESTGFDTVLYVRSVCDDGNSELTCNDDNDPPGGTGSHIDLTNLPPGTYYLFLDGYGGGSSGSYTLTVDFTDLGGCPDVDGDGFDDIACGGTDCDDGDPGAFPGALEICGDGIDQDCDGADEVCPCPDADGDGFDDIACGGNDCDDGDPGAFPGALEICGDGIDQDCDGADEVCPCPDADGDGFDDIACGGNDCDDGDPGAFPGAPETCGDGIDQDCDGADEVCPCPDADGDGVDDIACGGTDCNDADPTVFPGALEVCGDGIDQDCDGADEVCPCPDADGDGVDDIACGGTDCNDADPAIFPGALEVCGDGIDQDCDGTDEVCPCPDADGDGATDLACGGSDCDDADPSINPGATEVCGDGIDQDCDGADEVCPCPDADGDGATDLACGGTDCDDTDPSINPGASEVCDDGIDQDCNGSDLACTCADADADGFDDGSCGGTDCNDADPTIFPGALEICGDGVDQDCDGADEVCPCPDADGDGVTDIACGGTDCDDTDPAINPGASEVCDDGIDQDCNGSDLTCGCADVDADGFEDAACGGTDCNDADPAINPGAAEVCGDGIDQDCDGTDETCTCADADADGFEDAACGGPDCDDTDSDINPAAEEICDDGIDQDCNGSDLACTCADADADGFEDVACGGSDCDDADAGINPGASEVCDDGIDQDCDGADEACACPDADGDGHSDLTCGGTDCDDTNADINPGAVDICDDGVDQDCSGTDQPCDCPDSDNDGFQDAACGGDDCNDLDPDSYPLAPEDCSDDVDNDCDGFVDGDDPDCGNTGGGGCGCATEGRRASQSLLFLLGAAIWLRRRRRS